MTDQKAPNPPRQIWHIGRPELLCYQLCPMPGKRLAGGENGTKGVMLHQFEEEKRECEKTEKGSTVMLSNPLAPLGQNWGLMQLEQRQS